jgi:hypothetical protein
MRHRIAILETTSKEEHLHKCGTKVLQSASAADHEERHVALNRMIFAMARKRYQNRPTFKQRLVEQQEQGDGPPTLWRLSQSPQILKEALQDIAFSVKVCRLAYGGAQQVADMAVEKAEAEALDRRHRQLGQLAVGKVRKTVNRLSALKALNDCLHDARAAETEWGELMAAI